MKQSPLFWCALGAALCFNTIASADISYEAGNDYDVLYGNSLRLEDTKGDEASGIWSELTPDACALSGVNVDGSVTVTPTGNVFSVNSSDYVCRVKLVDHEGLSHIQDLRIGRRGLNSQLTVNARGYDGTDTVTATGVESANGYSERVPGDDVTIITGTLPESFSLSAHFDSSAYDTPHVEGSIYWSPASQLPNAGNYRFYTQQGIGEWGGILTGSDANKYFLNEVSSQQFIINKVNLRVECQNNSVNYSAAAPQYVAVVSGFVNGEGLSDLNTEPTCSSEYNPGDREGTYAITGTGGASENYEFEYLDGTLTVIDNRPEGGGSLSTSSASIAEGDSDNISLSSTTPGNWSIGSSNKFTISLTGGTGTTDTVTLTGNTGQQPGTENIEFTFTPTDVSFKPTTHIFEGTLVLDLDSNFGGEPEEGSVGGSFDLSNTLPYSQICGCSEYTSSDTSVATVTSGGVISFVAEGNVLISWISDAFGGDVQRTFSVSSSAPTLTQSGDGKTLTVGGETGGTLQILDGTTDVTSKFTVSESSGTYTATANSGEFDGSESLSLTAKITDSAGNISPASTAVTGSIDTTSSSAPTALIATAGDGQVSIAFTAPADNGGAAISDYQYELDDSGTWTSASTATSPVVITGLTNGTAYAIKVRAVNSIGNGNESAGVSVLLGSPASEFAAKQDVIRSVITDDAQRSLSSTLARNTRLTRDARGRFLTSRTQRQSDGAGLASRNNIALDVDGIAVATPEQLSTQGMFFAQTGNFEGTQRRLVFGDFDIQRDWDTGSTTATINGKVAWEQMLSEQTMLGYYLGGEVALSNIQGSFTGTQDKYGISVGGYFVHALQENLFLDGFASLGAGRNNVEMADDTLALTSDYTTRTATMGAAVSGVYEYGQYDFHPELAFSYGKTWIGDVGFTGVAYGLTDDALSLDAGDVSIANLTLRPEIVWALDAETVADSLAQLSFAPRFICQRTSAAATTQDCGLGAELGISSSSSDGLTSLNATIIADRVGNSTRSSLQLNLEHEF